MDNEKPRKEGYIVSFNFEGKKYSKQHEFAHQKNCTYKQRDPKYFPIELIISRKENHGKNTKA